MSKKRIVALLAAVAVVATLFAGCGSKEEKKPAENGKQTEKKVKVGLSTDEGGLNDKSFNQAADEGIKKAQTDFKVDYKPIESKTKEDYESNLEALVADGADITFAVGFQMEEALKNVSAKHTDKKFAIIDSVVDAPNVQSIVFKEHEGSFLMGVIAGKMTKTNKVGFIGGKDFELINRFEAGFAAGVKAVNPKAAEGLIRKDGKTLGATTKYADSFGDTAKGKALAQSLLNDGCDVIYHAAGGVGIGMFQAVQEAKKAGKNVWAIGVDMDQAVTAKEFADVILSSMIKRVDTGTYEATKAVVENTFKGNSVLELGLKEGGVGIAPSSDKNTPKDVLDLVAKYEKAVKDGTIVVPAKVDEVAKFAPAAVQ